MKLVDVRGGKIGVWESGAGDPALILHGGPGLSDYTHALARELSGRFRAIRYQQRGLPPTTLDRPFSVEAHVADAVALLDALGIERAWAVGHSWGGHLAMHLARSRPDRLLGLAVIGGLGAVEDGGEAEFSRRLTSRLSPEEAARAEEIDKRAERGGSSEEEFLDSLRILWPHYYADLKTAPAMPKDMRISLPCYSQTWASMKEHLKDRTLERGLPAYRGRAVFIHGKQDPIPHEIAAKSAALIQGAKLVLVDDCGHMPWLERPGSVLAAL